MPDAMIRKMIPFFKAYGIKKAALFGSVARGQNTPDSDVDLVVSFGKSMICWISLVSNRIWRKRCIFPLISSHTNRYEAEPLRTPSIRTKG